MNITEQQLKEIIQEGVKKAISGYLNVPEYDVNKSIKQVVTMLDAEADKFYQKYQDFGADIYDAYYTRLYAISEKLEHFMKEFKEDRGF